MSFVWMDGCTTLLDMPARGGSHESRGGARSQRPEAAKELPCFSLFLLFRFVSPCLSLFLFIALLFSRALMRSHALRHLRIQARCLSGRGLASSGCAADAPIAWRPVSRSRGRIAQPPIAVRPLAHAAST